MELNKAWCYVVAFLRLNISLAAVFCTRCSGSTVDCGRPARTELQ